MLFISLLSNIAFIFAVLCQNFRIRDLSLTNLKKMSNTISYFYCFFNFVYSDIIVKLIPIFFLVFFFILSFYVYKNYDADRYNQEFLLLTICLKITGLVSICIGSQLLFFIIFFSLIHRATNLWNQWRDDNRAQAVSNSVSSAKIFTEVEYQNRCKELTELKLTQLREFFMSRRENSDFQTTQVLNR